MGEHWERFSGRWEDYPVGTQARDHTGSRWTKLAIGVWRARGGDYFPRPGASALEVTLPASSPSPERPE